MNKLNNISLFILLLFFLQSAPSWSAENEDGHELWLRYKFENIEKREQYVSATKGIYIEGNSPTTEAIKRELKDVYLKLHGKDITFSSSPLKKGLNIIFDKSGKSFDSGKEGYRIQSHNSVITISSIGDSGLLYGTFHLLRLLQTNTDISSLDIAEKPLLQYRMLNQWDNLDGSIERGYSGKSIYDWGALSDSVIQRYEDFARANASLSINAIAINNVNADPRILREDYLKKVAEIADVFRPYNIRLFLSANYASPMKPSSTSEVMKKWGGIGSLDSADPLNEDVIKWWEDKVGEIYKYIPDFGGFVVKANSEGMPGPQDYGRNHEEGANMLARILKKYDAIVVWRAFVYGGKSEKDRAKHAFQEFSPLDGAFDDNVFVQVKNGPLDFQVYEPAHPLFGVMQNTKLMGELQITQEYLGHSTYLIYLGSLWSDFLSFDTKYSVLNSTIADMATTQKGMTGIAAVANVGMDRNWTGHHFAQANWYLYGRLAWNPYLDIKEVASEWIKCTWSNKPEVVSSIYSMMDGSREAFADLQNPLGLIITTDTKTHYHPAFEFRANKLWFIDSKSIGFDRTTNGSDYVSQYSESNKIVFNDINSCPEELLLFFHKVNWNHRLKSGLTLKDEIEKRGESSIKNIEQTIQIWLSLENETDGQRYTEVLDRLQAQQRDALIFKKARDTFFESYW